MTRLLFPLTAVLALTGLYPDRVAAQPFGPRAVPAPPGPTVSPYLNLLRPGYSPAINYYGLVRPQLDTYAGFQALRQGLLQSQAAGGTDPGDMSAMPATGRPAGFMTHQVYFMTTGGPTAARPTFAVQARVTTGGPTPSRLPPPGPR